MKTRLPFFLAAMAAFWLAAGARAQNYNIDWHQTAGGGGTSINGQYSLSGTVGQADANPTLTGGNYSLTGGFWSLISVAQPAGAPLLRISLAGSSVTVFWQAVPGWTLQQKAGLAAAGGWCAAAGVTTANGTNSLTIASPAGAMFFRLAGP